MNHWSVFLDPLGGVLFKKVRTVFRLGLVAVLMAGPGLVFGEVIKCEGDYAKHLQGVCRDPDGNLFWSFTDQLVKTDAAGKAIRQVSVADHHGDLCYLDGKVYVAVNLGKFNDPGGNADSRVYVYDALTLEEVAVHPVPEVFHGAGGMDSRDGKFYIVGGLPAGVEENYVYEYDSDFNFVNKHILSSGWTHLGIQTAAWHDGSWWFGCYGKPAVLLKANADLEFMGRFECNVSLGIAGMAKGAFLVAEGARTESGRHRGVLRTAVSDPKAGIKRD
ncbi:MAG: hypothetical protein P1U89_27065 [Verrucomicrobiales bacterium]|nr:hypothetical protein [Verrucomicrobiales bacterium]